MLTMRCSRIARSTGEQCRRKANTSDGWCGVCKGVNPAAAKAAPSAMTTPQTKGNATIEQIRNPYTPGAGIMPPVLAGRDKDIAEFEIALRRLSTGNHARSTITTGVRGVGKTVLLNKFGEIAERNRWVHQDVEITEGTDLSRLVFGESLLILDRMADSGTEPPERAYQALKAFGLRRRIPGASAVWHGEPHRWLANSGILRHDLTDLLLVIGGAAQTHESIRGVVFTIDEMQLLKKSDLCALVPAVSKISQKGVPVMIAGAGLPHLSFLVEHAAPYSDRLLEFRNLGNLDEIASKQLLAGAAATEGVRWSEEALGLVVSQAKGYPYFLQEFGKKAWNVAAGSDSVEFADAETAVRLTLRELDSDFYEGRYIQSTDEQIEYMAAMASLGSGPQKSIDVAQALGWPTAQTEDIRSSLLEDGLCYQHDYIYLSFTVPMFGDFLKRRTSVSL